MAIRSGPAGGLRATGFVRPCGGLPLRGAPRRTVHGRLQRGSLPSGDRGRWVGQRRESNAGSAPCRALAITSCDRRRKERTKTAGRWREDSTRTGGRCSAARLDVANERSGRSAAAGDERRSRRYSMATMSTGPTAAATASRSSSDASARPRSVAGERSTSGNPLVRRSVAGHPSIACCASVMSAAGRRSMNMLPPPSRGSYVTSPPCAAASPRAMASPSPALPTSGRASRGR